MRDIQSVHCMSFSMGLVDPVCCVHIYTDCGRNTAQIGQGLTCCSPEWSIEWVLILPERSVGFIFALLFSEPFLPAAIPESKRRRRKTFFCFPFHTRLVRQSRLHSLPRSLSLFFPPRGPNGSNNSPAEPYTVEEKEAWQLRRRKDREIADKTKQHLQRSQAKRKVLLKCFDHLQLSLHTVSMQPALPLPTAEPL